jgi:signal peptidase I
MEENYQSQETGFADKLKSNLIELIEFIAIVLAILISIRFFAAEPHKVSGLSMVPNFHDADYIITNKLMTRFSEPQRGEVIILQNPKNTDVVFIKRIIGLPRDTIKLLNGKVYLNGNELTETYLPEGLLTYPQDFLREDEEFTVPEDNYFVLGDNRGNSSDSRSFGPIKKELIVGQAWLRYWPLQTFKFIKIGEKSS